MEELLRLLKIYPTKRMKKTADITLFWILIFILIFLSCCEKQELRQLGHDFEIDARLPQDANGYYHLQISDDWQTLHRISGQVSPVEASYDLTKMHWESSHYWYIGDTLGYIIHYNNLTNDTYWYMTEDTTYITWFDGFEVPTINSASYSTEDGEINTMFAPVRNMKGDTVTVIGQANFADGYISEKTIKIVLE